MFRHTSSYSIIVHNISPYFTIFHHILSCYIIDVIFHHMLSFVSSDSIIFLHIPSYSIMFHHIQSCFVIFHHVLSYFIICQIPFSSCFLICHCISSYFTILYPHPPKIGCSGCPRGGNLGAAWLPWNPGSYR